MLDVITDQRIVMALLLSVPRLLVIMTLIPFFGRTTLPGLVRNGVVLSLSFLIVPPLFVQLADAEFSSLQLFGLLAKEAFIGLAMGFAFVIVFHAVEAVGFYIDNQRGSAMASSIDPLLGGQTSSTGLLLTQAFVVYFFVSGGFLSMLGVIYASYVVLPVLSYMPTLPRGGMMFFLGQVDRLAYLTFVLAMPVFAAMFLAEIGTALVSRFAPQMNVFVLAMPIKSGVAILALILYVRIFLTYVDEQVVSFPLLFDQLRPAL